MMKHKIDINLDLVKLCKLLLDLHGGYIELNDDTHVDYPRLVLSDSEHIIIRGTYINENYRPEDVQILQDVRMRFMRYLIQYEYNYNELVKNLYVSTIDDFHM